MTWIKKVNRVCKCGHKHNPDHKNQKSFLGFKFDSGTKCNVSSCCCKQFLDRRFPTKFDKGMMIMGFICMGLTIFVFGSMIAFLNIGLECHTDVCNQALDKPILSIREVGNILKVILLFLIIWTVFRVYPSDYFRNKKIKTEPIPEEKKELLFDGFEIETETSGEKQDEQKSS